MSIEVRKTLNKGRGVFALHNYDIGDIIEVCPTLIYKNWDHPTPIDDYCFVWQEGTLAFLFGYGSLYNHSYKPNAIYQRDFDKEEMVFKALWTIYAGDEITINYNGVPQAQDNLWFDPL